MAPHLVDLVPGPQSTVGSWGWTGPQELHATLVPHRVERVGLGEGDGQAVRVLEKSIGVRGAFKDDT